MKKLMHLSLVIVMTLTVGLMLPNKAEAATLKKTSVTVTRTNYNKAKLTFKKVSGVTGYKVYRSTKSASGYKLIKTTKSLTYTTTIPKYDKTYYYKVKTYKGKKLSAYSNKVKVGKITGGQKNAIQKAKSYLSFMPFSKQGLIDQLKFEKFSDANAKFAVNNIGANWKSQALLEAKSYLSFMPFSYQGLIDQLKFEKYTDAEAKYGVDNCKANWNTQAYKAAKNYLDFMAFSYEGLIEQLSSSYGSQFTLEQAIYAADRCVAEGLL